MVGNDVVVVCTHDCVERLQPTPPYVNHEGLAYVRLAITMKWTTRTQEVPSFAVVVENSEYTRFILRLRTLVVAAGCRCRYSDSRNTFQQHDHHHKCNTQAAAAAAAASTAKATTQDRQAHYTNNNNNVRIRLRRVACWRRGQRARPRRP